MTQDSIGHLGLVFAGEQALHRTNENGICQYCGRLSEEIKIGYYQCTGYQGFYFENLQYSKVPRHPLFLDVIKVLRNCGYCQNKSYGLCKRHQALEQFLESDSKYAKREKGVSVE